ncbi:MAG: class I SAM-dependent DNA methyltransferase [Paludibacteraceae bacterium]
MTLQQIYNKLELTDEKGCLIRLSDENWANKVSFPSRIMRLLKKNNLLRTMDAFFCFDNKPLILFFDSPKDKKALHQAIWNFNESPIAIIIDNGVVEIFNGFAIDENTKLLRLLGGAEQLNDFTYFELVTGKTWGKYHDEINHRNRVDYRLLDNIETAQRLLKEQGVRQSTANALLGKIIFFRYLIDRKVSLHYQDKDQWSNDDLCNCLRNITDFKAFVQYIENKDTGFNGEMFCIEESEFAKVNQNALHILIRLLQSEELSTGQRSLFDMYDFSILPIEFISNVYEKFIGKENQKKKGAYYTPTFLVDYIVSETVGKKIEKSNEYNCKVLDPACGSGIFLVESLRRMIEKYISMHQITSTNTLEFKEALKQIVKDNIFGIDKDYSAIQVAIFSVYLTLLDYQSPADIGNFKFPNLIGTNFICSDVFDVCNDKLRIFEERKYEFDFVIGNPPWKRGGVEKKSHCEKYLETKGYLNKLRNRELAQAFVFRSLDFTCSKTQCALVLVSKILYNIGGKEFRSYLLDNVFINQVFELAPVRKEVFNRSNDPAIAPPCILFYQNAEGKATDDNIITHMALKPSRFFSLFKIFSLSRCDIQRVQQDRLKQYDWLWKVLVYGSYLDFVFVKRIKEKPTIDDVIKANHFIRKQGVKERDNNRAIDTSVLVGLNYITTRGLRKYYANTSGDKWRLAKVGYIYRDKKQKVVTDLYKAPILLVTGGTTIDLHAVSAISYSDGVFKSSLTGIRGVGDSHISILRNMLGTLNSSLFAYYNLLTFSSSGIEREETHDTEKLNTPYCEGIDKMVEVIENHTAEFYGSVIRDVKKEQQIDKKIKELDTHIYELFHCSDIERDIIDYALQISIPLAVKSKGYERVFDAICPNDKILEEYALVFINHFARSFNGKGKRFVVEIHYSTAIIGMFFKVINKDEFIEEITILQGENFLSSVMATLSSEKVTDDLFVQKDIRGFDRECFYIFKPNEKRLWHRAVAHLDVNEFDDAMLKVGRDK